MTAQTFEEAIAEFMERSREQLEQEVMENLPPAPPSPYEQSGPPFESPLVLDPKTIHKYTHSIGDGNPLFNNPEYGRKSRYGAQLAPGPILALVRYPSAHGAKRPEGYPMANFISGTAWEFYDVLRAGAKFRSSKVTKEFIERSGTQGTLLFLISEVYYWDYHGDMPAKCYGTQIMVPQETMETSRSMPVERLGEHMMYERKASQYSPEQIHEFLSKIEGMKRRGAEKLYWEDVAVGDTIGPMVLPPWTLQDQICQHSMQSATQSSEDYFHDSTAFEPFYNYSKHDTEWARVHPVTRWPHSHGDEHEDALLAIYRGQPAPFDFGVQRVQIPQRLLTDWMGDEGFIRRMYIAMRRPVYYGDFTVYTGEVMKKYREVQTGTDEPGGTPGRHEYHALGIRIDGTNQVGEPQAPGSATVYLPSREGGPVRLPVPHSAKTPYVNYNTFRRDWY